jgi:hypothetical protein
VEEDNVLDPSTYRITELPAITSGDDQLTETPLRSTDALDPVILMPTALELPLIVNESISVITACPLDSCKTPFMTVTPPQSRLHV